LKEERIMAEQVIEGTWEEIVSQAEKLAGSKKRVKLIIPSESSASSAAMQNEAALALLEEWLEEDRAVSLEAREEANREWEEFRAGLEAHPVSVRITDID
jgi:hypothetical protein